MKRQILTGFLIVSLLLIVSVQLASALIVEDVNQGELYPGEKTTLTVDIKNNLNMDVDEVSFRLDLSGTQFITEGGSEQSIGDIREDKSESVDLIIKASQDIKPGDYNIPYTLVYNNGSIKIEKKGTLGITVGAKTELDYAVKTENPIVGQKGKITLIITNKGFGDIKFVSVKVSPEGYNLISTDSIYIGTIGSDDFETAVYDVTFNNKNSRLVAEVEYRDFSNKKVIQNINLPIKVYTKEEAVQAGIISPDKTIYYAIIFVIIIALFFGWRIYKIRKRKKNNKGG